MRLSMAALSKPGGRARNEDAWGHWAGPGGEACWVVADGLGGHRGGDIAAQTAVEAFLASFAAAPGLPLRQHVQAAHAAIAERQGQAPGLANMRSTLVALACDGVAAGWAHVGDSRLYRFRGGRLAAQTKDHSVPQALVDLGEIGPQDIRRHEDRNRLLRDLGGAKEPRPTLTEAPFALQTGDVFLLCTDGFWEPVTEAAMETSLGRATEPGQWLADMEAAIIQNACPGQDNYTAIAVFAG